MYLSKEERKDAMVIYGCEDFIEDNHYEVGSDTWIYLYRNDDKKYILIVADYLGDYDFEVFPHLLKFEDNRFEFVLQREIPVKNQSLSDKIHASTILFEYAG